MELTFTGERYIPELRGQLYYEHFHRYALAARIVTERDVIDVGSGEGYGAALLGTVARSVLGVDVDAVSVTHAAARYASMNVTFRPGSATSIPAPDASFDVVTSFQTIEYLKEHEQMLAEVVRVLRPGGRLMISSPNKLVSSDAPGVTNPHHVSELYFHEFRDLLQRSFPNVRIFGQRVFGASGIYPLMGAAAATPWLGPSLEPAAGMISLPNPEYFVAICGCDPEDELVDLSSAYLDSGDDLLADMRSFERASTTHATGLFPTTAKTTLPNERERLRSAETDLEALRARVSELEKETERLSGQLQRAERRYSDVGLELLNVEDEAARLETRLAAANEHIEVMGRAAQLARIYADELASQLPVMRRSLAATSAERERLDRDLRDAQNVRLTLVRYVRQMASRAEQAERTNEQLRAELVELQSSRAWRIGRSVGRVTSIARRAIRR